MADNPSCILREINRTNMIAAGIVTKIPSSHDRKNSMSRAVSTSTLVDDMMKRRNQNEEYRFDFYSK